MMQRPDLDEITRAASILFEPGQVIELRAKGSNGTTSGYFNDPAKLAQAAERLSKNPETEAVYWTLQRCNPDLLARSANVTKNYAKITTSDNDILSYRWLPIDCDPIRPSGISATDSEKSAAHDVALSVRQFLAEHGIATLLADSGNGLQLLSRIDLSSDEDSRRLVERVLKTLARRFNTPTATVDVKVFNPSRVWKAYGTVARKGSNLPERPHRLSRILDAPPTLPIIQRETLECIAEPEASDRTTAPELEKSVSKIEDLLASARIEHRPRQSYKGGFKWQLASCPFGEHAAPDSVVFLRPNGALAFSCSHNSCQQYDWQSFRAYAEQRIGSKFSFSDDSNSPFTDLANAKRLVKVADGNLRFCSALGGWLHWTGKVWELDEGERYLNSLIEPVLSVIHQEGRAFPEPDKYYKHAKASANKGRIEAMFHLAKPMLGLEADAFDADPWLFNVENGTIDLRTQTFRPHRREDFCTRVAPVNYDANAQCPEWEKFINWATCGDPELVDYLQTAAGYALTGEISEQCIFFAYGLGDNGKSQVFETFSALWGDYARETSF